MNYTLNFRRVWHSLAHQCIKNWQKKCTKKNIFNDEDCIKFTPHLFNKTYVTFNNFNNKFRTIPRNTILLIWFKRNVLEPKVESLFYCSNANPPSWLLNKQQVRCFIARDTLAILDMFRYSICQWTITLQWCKYNVSLLYLA